MSVGALAVSGFGVAALAVVSVVTASSKTVAALAAAAAALAALGLRLRPAEVARRLVDFLVFVLVVLAISIASFPTLTQMRAQIVSAMRTT